MELFKESDKSYCDSIQKTEYTQKIDMTENLQMTEYPSLINVFLTKFDPHLSLMDDKELYIKQSILQIASDIDENKELFDSMNYHRIKPSLIQYGLQMNNRVSSLLYLSDLYQVSTIVYIESKQIKILTSPKQRGLFHIIYTKNGKWLYVDMITEKYNNYKLSEFSELAICLTLDIKTSDIYKKFLQPIGKYKMNELVTLANERNINLMNETKKKVKKELYDEINLYELNK